VSGTDAGPAEALFQRHHEPLRRYLARFTGDPDLAADLAQEAFVRLLEQPPADNIARPWLFRVATNLALDSVRTQSRRRMLVMRGRAMRARTRTRRRRRSAVSSVVMHDAAVNDALASLSAKERMALLMREEGFTHTGRSPTRSARRLARSARCWPGRCARRPHGSARSGRTVSTVTNIERPPRRRRADAARGRRRLLRRGRTRWNRHTLTTARCAPARSSAARRRRHRAGLAGTRCVRGRRGRVGHAAGSDRPSCRRRHLRQSADSRPATRCGKPLAGAMAAGGRGGCCSSRVPVAAIAPAAGFRDARRSSTAEIDRPAMEAAAPAAHAATTIRFVPDAGSFDVRLMSPAAGRHAHRPVRQRRTTPSSTRLGDPGAGPVVSARALRLRNDAPARGSYVLELPAPSLA
jgi:RNA polymerase sigma factor (sigma-70 family)